MTTPSPKALTAQDLPKLLENDNRVKLAGLDVDGILRGKVISKKKFLSVAEAGFGFCSVIFGWDMHDKTYMRELKISNAENGYRDILAIPDLKTFRRIPWENNIPFFLISFCDPETKEPICYGAMAGAEYEFYTFKTPDDSKSPAPFLQQNPHDQLPSLTEGMFGYSLNRPVHNKDYYYEVFDSCADFACNIEGWHTESGPGVFEAALEFDEVSEMADRASLFKLARKQWPRSHLCR
ncbi:hypothetical protein NLG97_g10999 [Lecanicillium saksenae]|uniref:Uncharacterized protein n=1 Tax=Lecanicillium saksenae TaxID=468837 RepID=A0ACC1QER9_9HYPO|nr:hypothetical protein NLG97_g10999 [Lecanicillium saksenae]